MGSDQRSVKAILHIGCNRPRIVKHKSKPRIRQWQLTKKNDDFQSRVVAKMNDTPLETLDDAERISIEAVLDCFSFDLPNDEQKLDWSNFEFQQLLQTRRETRDPLERKLLTRQIRKYVRHQLRYFD